MQKNKPDSYSNDETEKRATAALRRALSTPYKPQRDMVGKAGGFPKGTPAGKRSKKTNPK